MGNKTNKNRQYSQSEQFQESYDKNQIKRKKFHQKDLCNFTGKSDNQHSFIRDYYETNMETFLLLGYAGTGKTFLAMRSALDDVLDPDQPYDKVVIFRSAVETRETGFKTGDEKAKDDVFSTPYRSLINDVFNLDYSSIYDDLESSGKLIFKSSSNQRGLTYDNAIIIIDEIQNMNYGEIKTLYTRSGSDCRIIMCGDSNQDDLNKRKNDASGLKDWERVIAKMPETSITKFYSLDDIVRSGRIRDMIEAEIELGMS